MVRELGVAVNGPPRHDFFAQLAREDSERAERAYAGFSGTDRAEAPFYQWRARVWMDIAAGTPVAEAVEKWRQQWKKYAEENNAAVKAAPKIKRGPSAGHSAISHRWVPPDKVSAMEESHVRIMVSKAPPEIEGPPAPPALSTAAKFYTRKFALPREVAQKFASLPNANELARLLDEYAEVQGVSHASPIMLGVATETAKHGALPEDALKAIQHARGRKAVAEAPPRLKQSKGAQRIVEGQAYWTKIGGQWQRVVAVQKLPEQRAGGKTRWVVRVRRENEERVLPKARSPQSLKDEKPAYAGGAFGPQPPRKASESRREPQKVGRPEHVPEGKVWLHTREGGELVPKLYGAPGHRFVVTQNLDDKSKYTVTDSVSGFASWNAASLSEAKRVADAYSRNKKFVEAVQRFLNGGLDEAGQLALKNLGIAIAKAAGKKALPEPQPLAVAYAAGQSPEDKEKARFEKQKQKEFAEEFNHKQRQVLTRASEIGVEHGTRGQRMMTEGELFNVKIPAGLHPVLFAEVMRQSFAAKDNVVKAYVEAYNTARSVTKAEGLRVPFHLHQLKLPDSVKELAPELQDQVIGWKSMLAGGRATLKETPELNYGAAPGGIRIATDEARDLAAATFGGEGGVANQPLPLLDEFEALALSAVRNALLFGVQSAEYHEKRVLADRIFGKFRTAVEHAEQLKKVREHEAKVRAQREAEARPVRMGPHPRPPVAVVGGVVIHKEARFEHKGKRFLVKDVTSEGKRQWETYVVDPASGLEEWLSTQPESVWTSDFRQAARRALHGEYAAPSARRPMSGYIVGPKGPGHGQPAKLSPDEVRALSIVKMMGDEDKPAFVPRSIADDLAKRGLVVLLEDPKNVAGLERRVHLSDAGERAIKHARSERMGTAASAQLRRPRPAHFMATRKTPEWGKEVAIVYDPLVGKSGTVKLRRPWRGVDIILFLQSAKYVELRDDFGREAMTLSGQIVAADPKDGRYLRLATPGEVESFVAAEYALPMTQQGKRGHIVGDVSIIEHNGPGRSHIPGRFLKEAPKQRKPATAESEKRFRITAGPHAGKVGILSPLRGQVFGGSYGFPLRIGGILYTLGAEEVEPIESPPFKQEAAAELKKAELGTRLAGLLHAEGREEKAAEYEAAAKQHLERAARIEYGIAPPGPIRRSKGRRAKPAVGRSIVPAHEPHHHEGAVGHLTVQLSENEIAVVASLRDASKVVRDFIERGDLGSSAWYASKEIGVVRDEHGKAVGKISYNGRMWGPNDEPLSPPTYVPEKRRPEGGQKATSGLPAGFGEERDLPLLPAPRAVVHRQKRVARGRKEKACGPGIQGCMLVREYWRKERAKQARQQHFKVAVERGGKMVAEGPTYTSRSSAETALAMLTASGAKAKIIKVQK